MRLVRGRGCGQVEHLDPLMQVICDAIPMLDRILQKEVIPDIPDEQSQHCQVDDGGHRNRGGDEHHEGERDHACLYANLGAVEPVDLLAPVKDQLETADEKGDRQEADPVERGQLFVDHFQVRQDADQGGNADRQVDQENPVP